ncbi:ABC transporter substrate-binding protein [Actinopolymorpha alba]|uniref:ABC transporter substrate-binding protein n=1 Tax=Actinopolymorpha alba TaxID=533267 RepID=UPI00037EA446|nr:ABC transporter substrate-binding protein [Actinopolymorpha alba]
MGVVESHGGSLSRRTVLGRGALIALVGFTGSGCSAFSMKPSNGTPGKTPPASAGREAPALAALVKEGKLPPLKERLPKAPLTIEPLDGVSTYGGTWQDLLLGTNTTDLYRKLAYDTLVRWDPDWRKVIPNLAESWEVSTDGRVYTFHLRAGVKWSDGHPFTTDDIEFAYEGIISDQELTPTTSREFVSGGQLAKFKKIDDHTFSLTFVEPNGMFLERLAAPGFATSRIILPAHYLREFHPRYGANVEAKAKEQGHDNWRDLMLSKGGGGTISAQYWASTEIPTVFAWRVSRPLDSTNRLELERNPYYWKTDAEGRQLPYIDRIAFDVVSNPEVLLLKGSNGEVDFNADPFTIATLKNKPVLARGREKGKYEFVNVTDSRNNYVILAFNLNHRNPALRTTFQNKDFRIGLSYAINRTEIINAVFQRQGRSWQAAPRKESVYYQEDLATQYTAYDVDKANQHLDQAGLRRRDGDGFRLGPNGRRLTFAVMVGGDSPEWVSTVDLIRGYWRTVGIEAQISTVARELMIERQQANQYDVLAGSGISGMNDALLDPQWYFPYRASTGFAPAWGAWYESGGKDGEAPPAAAREQMRLYDEIMKTVDQGKRQEMFLRLLDISRQEFYVIGTVLPEGNYGIVRKRFRNVPKHLMYGWLYPMPGPTRPEQYAISG